MKKFVPEVVKEACEFAIEAHGNQKYGDKPYYYHLRAVVSTMQAFTIWDKDLLAAGYLHDVLEDTNLTYEDLADHFNPKICSIVDACTDGAGGNRKERKERPYTLIPGVPGAVQVKIADRLANTLANLVEGNLSLARMYRKEHPQFQTRLYGSIDPKDGATVAMAVTLDRHLAAVAP